MKPGNPPLSPLLLLAFLVLIHSGYADLGEYSQDIGVFLKETYPTKEVSILDNVTYRDAETGLSYHVVKVDVDGRIVKYSLNRDSLNLEEGSEQIARDREAYLSSLPPEYRKMSRDLRDRIDEGLDDIVPVIYITTESGDLGVIEEKVSGLYPDYRKWDGDLIKFVSAELELEQLLEVTGMDEVKAVWLNDRLNFQISTSVPLAGADQLWSNLSGGSLARVAVVDSGIDDSHPALENNVILRGDFSDGDLNPYTGDPDDFAGHGTLVAGIIASRDTTYTGMAPNAEIISVRTALTTNYLCAGVDWALDNGADVIQMSMAHDYVTQSTYGNSQTTKFVDYVAYLKDTTYVISAGNQDDEVNPDAHIEAPADNFNGISVGATSGSTLGELMVWDGSARGKTDDGRTKIDVVAPGGFIKSCNYNWETESDFTYSSGTSMAAPHVSGLAALLYHWGEAYSQLNDAVLIKAAILNSARKLDGWSHTNNDPLDLEQGAGFIDSVEAFNTYKSRPSTQPSGYRLHARIAYDTANRYHRVYVTDAPTNITATLVWRRNVSDITQIPPDLTDFDLYLYDGDITLLNYSSSSFNNVEHIHHQVELNGTYWLRVRTYSSLENSFEYYTVACNHDMTDYDTVYCIDCDSDGLSNMNDPCPDDADCDDDGTSDASDCAITDPGRWKSCNGECIGETSSVNPICATQPDDPRCGWKSVRYDSDSDLCGVYIENPVMADPSHEWYELDYDDSCWSDADLGDTWQEDCDHCDKFYRKEINVPGRLAQFRYKVASDDGYGLWVDSTNWEPSSPERSEGGTCSGTSYVGGCATSCTASADNDAWNDITSYESCGSGCDLLLAVHVYETEWEEWFDLTYELKYCGDGNCDSAATYAETSINCPLDCPTTTTTSTSTTTTTTSTTTTSTATTSTTTPTTSTTTSTTSTTLPDACYCGPACQGTNGCTNNILADTCTGPTSCDGTDDIETITLTNLNTNCGPINPGETLQIDIQVQCYSTLDRIEIWYHNGTAWKQTYTDPQCNYPGTTGHYYTTLTVDNAATTQYLRAIIAYGWSGGTSCHTGTYGDIDDITFQVATIATTTTTTTSTSTTTTTTSTTTTSTATTSTTTSTTTTLTTSTTSTTTSTTSTTLPDACYCGTACQGTNGCTNNILVDTCTGPTSCDGTDDIETITLTNLNTNCGPINPGETLQIDIQVQCYSTLDRIEIWYYNGTAWKQTYTDPQCNYPGTTGHYYTTLTVDNAATTQYLRAIIAYGWSGGTSCYTGTYGDIDDVTFQVAIIPTTTSTTSTTSTSTSTASPTTYTASSTTSSTTSTSTTSTTTSTSTTTLTEVCDLSGDHPPCSEITLTEIANYINIWTDGRANLTDVVVLINAWTP